MCLHATDEGMVNGDRMKVVVLHRFHATPVEKLSYSQVTSIYSSIRSECVRELVWPSGKALGW